MVRSRESLQTLLEVTLGSRNVYFQPPENISLEYPCIIYNRQSSQSNNADNEKYWVLKRYSLMFITRDPDHPVIDKIEWLPQVSFQRFYTTDQLNHYIYNILY